MAARAGRWLLSIAGDDGDGPELIACYGQVWTTILVEIADGTGKRPRSGYKGSGAVSYTHLDVYKRQEQQSRTRLHVCHGEQQRDQT